MTTRQPGDAPGPEQSSDAPGRTPGEQPLGRPSTLFSPKVKAGFALVVIVGALVYFGSVAFRGATVAYHTVSDAAQMGPTPLDRLIGVKGKLVEGSYVRSPDGLVANFHLRDEEGAGSLDVRYTGDIGQVFFNEHSEIILQGALNAEGVFNAEQLTVRCPSKYMTEEERAELEQQKQTEPRPAYSAG